MTEAGEGEDGRIKSAIGIGSLLCDGLGDTIRVSLTEDSVHEIPVARALVDTIESNVQTLETSRISGSPVFRSIPFPTSGAPSERRDRAGGAS